MTTDEAIQNTANAIAGRLSVKTTADFVRAEVLRAMRGIYQIGVSDGYTEAIRDANPELAHRHVFPASQLPMGVLEAEMAAGVRG